RLKLSLPESEAYTTIAGFLMTESGQVLKPGEVINYDGLEFYVERVEKRRVLSVRLEIPKPTNEEEQANVANAANK
ncbi:MAG: DNA-binding protein, partial [Acidobacteria bacterium]